MKKWLFTAAAAFLMAVLVLGAGVMEASAAAKTGTTSDGFSYEISKDNTVEITGYKGKKKNLKFPDKIKGKKVVGIGNGAASSRYVTSVTIPDTVKIVDIHAFYDCPNLATITLGKNVEAFTAWADIAEIDDYYYGFDYYDSNDESQYISLGKKFKGFKVSKKNKVFSAKDGVLFRKKSLVKCPPTKKGTYQVPKGTIGVYLMAFNDSQLSKVKLPASVRSVPGFDVDYEHELPEPYDSRIAAYEVDKGNKKFYSEDGVLFEKDARTFYQNIQGAGLVHYPPEKKDASYRVPENIRKVREWAFAKHKYLEEVEIPNAYVCYAAFDECKKLKRAVVSGYLGECAFLDCYELAEVEFVNAGDGKSSGFDGELVFGGSGLRSLILSETVTHLDVEDIGYHECLKWIEIRNRDCEIGDLRLPDKAVIYGYPGSTAEAYAKKTGHEFKEIGEAKPEIKNPVSASGVKVKLDQKSYTYDGETVVPRFQVKDKSGKVISELEYRVTYQNNKKPGLGVVKVTFKGYDYKGTIRTTFAIKPPKSTIKKLTPGKKSLTLQWGGVKSSWISGYEIQYSTGSAFEKGNTRNVNVKPNVVKKQIKKLKSGKTYYVRIRSYKTVQKDGKTEKLYSKWSEKKKVKTL